MKTVTAIEPQKAKRERVNLFLDGDFAFSLSAPVVAEFGLQPGQRLSPADIEEIKNADLLHRCLYCALRYLGARPRSGVEIKVRLRRYGFGDDIIQKVIAQLEEQKLVDDAAFARFWRENRESFRPRSRRLIEAEFRRKGVDAEIVAEALAGLDDERSAYQVAVRRAGSLRGLDYTSFRKRLGIFLKQRGFPYELINRTIEQIWREQVKPQRNNGEGERL